MMTPLTGSVSHSCGFSLYADIHRNEDLEKAMHIKYVAQVLEKVIFGSLVMEPEDVPAS